jgi:hypothetical protein
MAVLGVHGLVLQMPELDQAQRFYCGADLEVT